VLVATSGDTGSAVAHGFLGVPGIRVVILYPSKRISEAQEKQFTTLGENITALEVSGTFDDCQRLVKQAFSDEALQQRAFLTSANSINIGRLLPQMFYHVAAYRQLPVASVPLVVSVPSGNFGDMMGAVVAGLRPRVGVASGAMAGGAAGELAGDGGCARLASASEKVQRQTVSSVFIIMDGWKTGSIR
jgi:threonine synthase